jgi:predicted enzyme related to lactoylglutathione lyase
MPAAIRLEPLPLHAHGVPNWIDLHTTRIDEARVFYEALLGWTFRNRFTLTAVPNGSDGSAGKGIALGSEPATVMALSNDRPIAELVERNGPLDEMAPVSTWFPYVYVDDLTATLELVEPAGGLILNPPAKRGAMANVATILDPNDALLCLWQPLQHAEVASLHQPGSLTWIELETSDVDSAKKFYGELFGWDAGEVVLDGHDYQGGVYTVFTRHGEPVAGAVETAMTGIPASWCPSFAVTDVDAATAVSARNGGVLMAEPVDIPVGRQAIIVDPTGAAFSVLGPKSNRPRPL